MAAQFELGAHFHPDKLIKLPASGLLGRQDWELRAKEYRLVLLEDALILVSQAQLSIEDHYDEL